MQLIGSRIVAAVVVVVIALGANEERSERKQRFKCRKRYWLPNLCSQIRRCAAAAAHKMPKAEDLWSNDCALSHRRMDRAFAHYCTNNVNQSVHNSAAYSRKVLLASTNDGSCRFQFAASAPLSNEPSRLAGPQCPPAVTLCSALHDGPR